jgi:hypothetical protein
MYANTIRLYASCLLLWSESPPRRPPYTEHSGRLAISSERDGILLSHRLAGLLQVHRKKGVGAGVADTLVKIRPRTNLQ